MATWQTRDAEVMEPIFDYFDKERGKRPRTNCRTHGDQLVCGKCGICLRCSVDKQLAENLERCIEERHTFLNLFAPCKICQKVTFGYLETDSYCRCGSCNFHESLEAARRIKHR